MLDDDLAGILRALGHPVRLSILRMLAGQGARQCCCMDVTQSLPLAQSTVSQHIKVLLEAGLIERHARGTRNCYSVKPETLLSVERACGQLFGGLSGSFDPTRPEAEPTQPEPA